MHGSVELPQIKMLLPRPPHTYLGVAYSMMSGVQVLANAIPVPSSALAFLAAHVLECCLKAYLSRDGSNTVAGDHQIRHNLCALWSRAHGEQLQISASPPYWVELLSLLHASPYYLRYLGSETRVGPQYVHGISLPAAQPMTNELSELLRLVEQAISEG